jgi:hypothetical protein
MMPGQRRMNMQNLNVKRVVITGGNQGLRSDNDITPLDV